MRIANNITELIGRTPLVRLKKIGLGLGGILVAKLEKFNPGGSVKDRIALEMIKDAEKKGLIKKGSVIVEPTSGNTGVGLAMICAQRGYHLILTMPENVSEERKKILRLFGAEIFLTPEVLGMSGAIKKAEEIVAQTQNSLMLEQFKNPANPRAHYKTTAQEIWRDTDGKVDIVIIGVGTGGTLTGLAKFLKKNKKSVKIIAVEPLGSPVISGGKPGKHKIYGIGAGFIPEILKKESIDEIIQVSDEDAFETTKRLAREEGILSGISSGAVVWAGIKVAKRKENKGKMIVVVLPDTGERYLSILAES